MPRLTVPANSRAVNAAGAIHSDLEKYFIRAETIRWISYSKPARKPTPRQRDAAPGR